MKAHTFQEDDTEDSSSGEEDVDSSSASSEGDEDMPDAVSNTRVAVSFHLSGKT